METALMETDEFICAHCLQVATLAEIPRVCPSCRVGFCQDCGCRLAASAEFCYGCGRFGPSMSARMCRTSSFGGVYVEHGWMREGLPKGQDFYYSVSMGWDTLDDMLAFKPITHRLVKNFPDGTQENARELTEEECSLHLASHT